MAGKVEITYVISYVPRDSTEEIKDIVLNEEKLNSVKEHRDPFNVCIDRLLSFKLGYTPTWYGHISYQELTDPSQSFTIEQQDMIDRAYFEKIGHGIYLLQRAEAEREHKRDAELKRKRKAEQERLERISHEYYLKHKARRSRNWSKGCRSDLRPLKGIEGRTYIDDMSIEIKTHLDDIDMCTRHPMKITLRPRASYSDAITRAYDNSLVLQGMMSHEE